MRRESTSSPPRPRSYLLEVEIDRLAESLIEHPALVQIKVLVTDQLLPVCAWCQQLRDVQGSWYPKETVHLNWTDWKITHTICPTCAAEVTF